MVVTDHIRRRYWIECRDIEIYGSEPSLGKIEFDEVFEIGPSDLPEIGPPPPPLPGAFWLTRLQFSKVSTLDNAFVLGRTEQYNISEYLTPFIGFPKWCKFLYDYRLNSINKSIAKNCDLDYYAWVRTRSRNYTYDAEKIKLQLDSATNYGGAKALLSYNEPMFVTDIDTTTTITTYSGIFFEKDSRKDSLIRYCGGRHIMEHLMAFSNSLRLKKNMNQGQSFE